MRLRPAAAQSGRFPSPIAAFLALAAAATAAPAPDLPGIDVGELPPAWGDSATEVHRPDPARGGSGGVGAWAALPPEAQLAADPVLLAPGEAALFVPTMTQGRLEPRIEVLDARGRVEAVGPSGTRIRLSPGPHFARLGSGSRDQRLTFPFELEEGRTQILDPRWAGLTVIVIDPDRNPIQGEYKLVRQDRFQAYGEGYGLTEERLGDIQTWILPPGVYRITGLAAGSDDLTNFVTLRLLPGEWTEYTLVMDDDKVVGGGLLSLSPARGDEETWRLGLELGGSLAWSRETAVNQAGSQSSRNLTGFTLLRARRESGPWLLSGRIQYVGSAARQDDGPWLFTPDELTAQGFAVRRIVPRVGPYLRLTSSSHLFPTRIDLAPDGDTLSLWGWENGVVTRLSPGADRFRIAPPLLPLELRQGAGLDFDLFHGSAFEASLQGGGATRQLFQGGTWTQLSVAGSVLSALQAADPEADEDNAVVIRRVGFQHAVGLEATADLKARLGPSVSLSATPGIFRSFWPHRQLEYSLVSVASAHLSRHLSLDYRFSFKRALDEIVVHRYPSSQQILLRFSFGS